MNLQVLVWILIILTVGSILISIFWKQKVSIEGQNGEAGRVGVKTTPDSSVEPLNVAE